MQTPDQIADIETIICGQHQESLLNVMAEFTTVCRIDEIAEGTGRAFPVAGTIVAVFRQDGEFYAINDLCPHLGASLAEGSLEQGIVACPWHDWKFCIKSGEWCDSATFRTDTYDVRIVGDEIQVAVDGPFST